MAAIRRSGHGVRIGGLGCRDANAHAAKIARPSGVAVERLGARDGGSMINDEHPEVIAIGADGDGRHDDGRGIR